MPPQGRVTEEHSHRPTHVSLHLLGPLTRLTQVLVHVTLLPEHCVLTKNTPYAHSVNSLGPNST